MSCDREDVHTAHSLRTLPAILLLASPYSVQKLTVASRTTGQSRGAARRTGPAGDEEGQEFLWQEDRAEEDRGQYDDEQ
jgi:hypothetical protein